MRFEHATSAHYGACAIGILFIVATPVGAQDFACAANSPANDTSASTFLTALTKSVQGAWPKAVANIDPLAVPPAPDIGSGDIVRGARATGERLVFSIPGSRIAST